MKVLLASHRFSPSLGGTETASLAIARCVRDAGHEVRVATQTPSCNPKDDLGLHVLRAPSARALFDAVRWCDVFHHSNISLRAAWPLLLVRRPWVVTTHTWLRSANGSVGGTENVKRIVMRLARNTAVSHAVAEHLRLRCTVIPNSYDTGVFREHPGIERARDLIFVGRLVSEKGCDILIEALNLLHAQGTRATLTIVGDGPERELLERQVLRLGLERSVAFLGELRGEALARELNRHQIIAISSRCEETFGIVALEGIACGCVVVGSNGGGLPEAIGPCGSTFRNGDTEGCASLIRRYLEEPARIAEAKAKAYEHLACFSPERIGARYLSVLEECAPAPARGRSVESH